MSKNEPKKVFVKDLADKFCTRREAANYFEMDEFVLNNLISRKRQALELSDGSYIILNKYSKVLKQVARNDDDAS